jgi:23S rRNA (uracil1939-C5)-methyltransferase
MSRRRDARTVDLEIEALGPDGFGIARFERRPVHVKGALPGEVVVARVVRRRQGTWYALPENWLVRAASRVKPPCEAFMHCGGCSMQHLPRAAQLGLKQQWLLAQLASSGVEPRHVHAPVAGPQYHYRRRARLAVRSVRDRDELLVGFRESFGSRVARTQSCSVLVEPFARELTALAELIGALDACESIPQIEIAAGDSTRALVLRHLVPLSDTDRASIAKFQRGSVNRVLLQAAGHDSIVDLDGGAASPLSYRLDRYGVTLFFQPTDFVQVNAVVNELLVGCALAWLQPTPRDRIADLFCGIGNFSLPLARCGARVVGLEGSTELVERARGNGRCNGLASRAEFAVADLYAASPGAVYSEVLGSVNKVLLDPPRTGAGAVLSQLAHPRIERVAYVSCHPPSFANDAARLREAGFELSRLRIFDMFPQTTHVESLALFERVC